MDDRPTIERLARVLMAARQALSQFFFAKPDFSQMNTLMETLRKEMEELDSEMLLSSFEKRLLKLHDSEEQVRHRAFRKKQLEINSPAQKSKPSKKEK